MLDPHIAGDWIYLGVGDIMNGLVPHRMRRDNGSGRPGKLEPWPPAEAIDPVAQQP